MRKLAWMVEGREESEWARLSNLLALIYNRTRFTKDEPMGEPMDFNPFWIRDNKDEIDEEAASEAAALKAQIIRDTTHG